MPNELKTWLFVYKELQEEQPVNGYSLIYQYGKSLKQHVYIHDMFKICLNQSNLHVVLL